MKDALFEYDEKAAARILGIAPRTLRAWRVGGKVSHHRTPGGRVRYTMDDLLELQRRSRVHVTFSRIQPHTAAQQ
jgi:DNA-binding transcriptional MerR regulator